ncbi:hypothetical protein LCGC14_0423500 [marine sediment metagenome]|uniref:Uncharacterized protein n=1 Tax=marine sediment metagenome TaxID=412755 RepID=A0A0F9T888_9ZZZZ
MNGISQSKATIRPNIFGAINIGVDGMREEPFRYSWGKPCGRCGSCYTVKETYSSELTEYWCRYCGTELNADGSKVRTEVGR